MKACRSARPEISDSKNKRLDLAVKLEVPPCACAVEVRFAQPFHFDFADELADPLAGLRLLRREPNAGRWLREHDLGEMAVQVFELGLALESEYDGIPALAGFGDGGMKLRQLLQAGQLVDDEPHPPLRFCWAHSGAATPANQSRDFAEDEGLRARLEGT